jgi:hypothetical protein
MEMYLLQIIENTPAKVMKCNIPRLMPWLCIEKPRNDTQGKNRQSDELISEKMRVPSINYKYRDKNAEDIG